MDDGNQFLNVPSSSKSPIVGDMNMVIPMVTVTKEVGIVEESGGLNKRDEMGTNCQVLGDVVLVDIGPNTSQGDGPIDKPWLVYGDFNEVLDPNEKWGGWGVRPESQMEHFTSVLNDCELKDLGFARSFYTWCNRREDNDRICGRLDRFLANAKWVDFFSIANVQDGSSSYSDHVPV
ncbi:hypothetical protein F2P56_027074 [Juglans regia]|uniref:Uncharacterized protein n=1 Tax=Juglans regia TaxID=51240 RepID=A0A833WYX1_JUGRE|nr:hypothetical protein F2P56_027074 [Juglans regia]